MRFTPEGYVKDGLILCGFWEGDSFNSIEVLDLLDWTKNQFAQLRKQYENAPATSGRTPSTTRTIWLGGGEAPFASLQVNKSKFKVFFFHPEIVGLPENMGIFESADVDEISSVIIQKASKVSTFNWIGMIPKFTAPQD